MSSSCLLNPSDGFTAGSPLSIAAPSDFAPPPQFATESNIAVVAVIVNNNNNHHLITLRDQLITVDHRGTLVFRITARH